ncbi:hypothetical protein FHR75_004372 [Kineococcus radiotolerans]|uniref:Uncharacterized protein n=1 Tax=Kineococcus radiotolerans TaxID=131568 RepID=A0A7W4TR16_KINRA|nr:hypothetical protein [Kineococcus radiotolerans]
MPGVPFPPSDEEITLPLRATAVPPRREGGTCPVCHLQRSLSGVCGCW